MRIRWRGLELPHRVIADHSVNTPTYGKFTVERVECQGACANAPMFDLDGVYHEDLDDAKVAKILGDLK